MGYKDVCQVTHHFPTHVDVVQYLRQPFHFHPLLHLVQVRCSIVDLHLHDGLLVNLHQLPKHVELSRCPCREDSRHDYPLFHSVEMDLAPSPAVQQMLLPDLLAAYLKRLMPHHSIAGSNLMAAIHGKNSILTKSNQLVNNVHIFAPF